MSRPAGKIYFASCACARSGKVISNVRGGMTSHMGCCTGKVSRRFQRLRVRRARTHGVETSLLLSEPLATPVPSEPGLYAPRFSHQRFRIMAKLSRRTACVLFTLERHSYFQRTVPTIQHQAPSQRGLELGAYDGSAEAQIHALGRSTGAKPTLSVR